MPWAGDSTLLLAIDMIHVLKLMTKLEECWMKNVTLVSLFLLGLVLRSYAADEFPKPYSAPCTERENVFEFTDKPAVKTIGNDRFEIAFAVKGNCDATVAVVDSDGKVIRHVGSGVLGANAPAPFQKNSLKQVVAWDGKDDLGEYVKEPEKLRVKVMLGLKPTHDRLLGPTHPRSLPGYVFGVAVAEDGVFVMSKGNGAHGNLFVRKFDHDGNYSHSILPPPANLPEAKLAGMGWVEYEKGVRALHGPDLYQSVADNGFIFAGVGGYGIASCQPAVVGDRIYFCNGGADKFLPDKFPSMLFYTMKDGSVTSQGISGMPFVKGFMHPNPRLAVSPDGRWLYISSLNTTKQYSSGNEHAVLRRDLTGNAIAEVFVGKVQKPGSDSQSLNNPQGIDCDAQGRLYVCDHENNRIQVFASDGKSLKSIPSERPELVQVHKKTGAIYIKHKGRVQGATVERLTKVKSFDDATEAYHIDGVVTALVAVDSWTAKPRLWMAGTSFGAAGGTTGGAGPSVTVWEEDGAGLKKILDFDESVKREMGQAYGGRPDGHIMSGRVACDPVRETVNFNQSTVFDLKTGKLIGTVRLPHSDDVAFDKKGYMHVHFNPGFYGQGVARLDPGRAVLDGGKLNYPEVPYDYGIDKKISLENWKGILPVRDQPGAKFFQEGLGVNMRGELAVESNIYYIPKMEESSWQEFTGGGTRGQYAKLSSAGQGDGTYAGWMRTIENLQKRGEEVYSIPMRPGVTMTGATIWTFDSLGRLRQECAVIAGRLINASQIDEDGYLYFVVNRPRMFGEKHFLVGKGGIIGAQSNTQEPFTGTLLKTRPENVKLVKVKATIPMDGPPSRPPDLMDCSTPTLFGKDYWMWVEGAEWLYAGASPITCNTCACPQQRMHTDWFKRTYVPEMYRHSLGVVDTAGNLIMHLGRYGNFDSGNGLKSKIPVGDDGIAMFMVRFVSGTDNYLVYDDYGERTVVLKLNYHAEEIAGIGAR
ncbi:MAG: hypothetical protein C0404_06375 [Verrucomicrobia bacterium]|nr:hypothetical protein [Verrucomicrobiota bacterium]